MNPIVEFLKQTEGTVYVDQTRKQKTLGLLPPLTVVVYQTDSLLHLVREMVRGSTPPWKSQIADVHESLATRIWRENPCAMSRSQCRAPKDYELKAFAESLDETWEFIDLRNPKIGDGYWWQRYGPKTVNKRYGNKRVFACQKKSLGRRFLEAFR